MPVANVILPQQEEYKPVQEVPETPPLLRSNHKSSKSTGHFYKKKFKNSDRDYKASPSYFNSIYPATISSLPALQNQNGLSPVSLGNQYHQGGPSASLSVAAGSLMVPTYGPAKAVDYHHKIRTSNNSPETMYHRLTGRKSHGSENK